MIYLVKAIYSFFIPPGILVLLLAGLAFGTRRRSKKTATLLAIITIILYIASTNYFGAFFIRSLEDRYSIPAKIEPDVIVVLGGGATSDTPDISGLGGLSGSAANRLLTAVRLYNIHKVPIVFSGGQVFRDTANESQIAARLLEDLGVSQQDIIAEDKSLNTTENAKYVKEILGARGFRNPILVTSAFHMERAVANFEKVGVQVTPLPADYQVSRQSGIHINNMVPSGAGMYLSSLATKEYLGILALGGK